MKERGQDIVVSKWISKKRLNVPLSTCIQENLSVEEGDNISRSGVGNGSLERD